GFTIEIEVEHSSGGGSAAQDGRRRRRRSLRRQGWFVGGWFVFQSWKAKTDDFGNMFFLHEHLSAGLRGDLISNFLLWQEDCSADFLAAARQGKTPGAWPGQFAANLHPAAGFL